MDDLKPLTQEEVARVLETAPRCCVCRKQPPVVNQRAWDHQGRGRWDAAGWMRFQYPIPVEEVSLGAYAPELKFFCPKDAARAAGLLAELEAGRTRR